MVEIRIEKIVDRLSSEMRRALMAALEEVLPEAEVNDREFFRAFRRAVGRKCSTWEQVPDDLVERR